MSSLEIHSLTADGYTLDVWMSHIPAKDLECLHDLPQQMPRPPVVPLFFRWLTHVTGNELARRHLKAQGEPVEDWKPSINPNAFTPHEAVAVLYEGMAIVRSLDRNNRSEQAGRLVMYACTQIAGVYLWRMGQTPPPTPAPVSSPFPIPN